MSWRDAVGTVWQFILSNAVSLLVALGVLIYGIFFVRPFERARDPTGDDIGVAWNQTIARLGIVPVYPPTEDLSVGDVWAIIADSDQTPLLGKAVRIGHIDLRQSVLAASTQPIFADTTEPSAGASYARQERYEVLPADPKTAERIPLAITAFPGITITHAIHSGAAAGNGTAWFGSKRGQEQRDEIRIASAETYGVPAVDAILTLNRWCKAKETAPLCADNTVRNILSYTVGDQVLTVKNNEYSTRLGLQLVTRVFLTRTIEQRRANNSAGGASAQLSADPSQGASSPPGSPPTTPEDAQRLAALTEAVNKSLNPSGSTGSRLSMVRSDGLDISLKETFQRPIAFGYRAVTISLPLSTPTTKGVP